MRQHLEEVGVQEVASQGEGGSLVGIMRPLPRVLVFLFGLLAVCLMDNEGRLCLQSFDRGPLRYFRCLELARLIGEVCCPLPSPRHSPDHIHPTLLHHVHAQQTRLVVDTRACLGVSGMMSRLT